jgi:hypothetical protein
MMPIYGFVEGDTLGLLILADASETVASLADKIQRSASVRMRPREGACLVYRGRVLDAGLTVIAAGITALDRVDLVFHGATGGTRGRAR